MTVISPLGVRRPAIDRSGDRRVTLAGIVIAVAYLGAALVALALPEEGRRGLWLPLHLALAGGAASAIVAVMPFFVAAFAAAPPARGWIRAASLATTAGGAAAVTIGVVGTVPALAAAGGIAFITGLVLAAVAMLTVVRGALGPARGIVVQGYAAALASVVIGASLATLDVAGATSVVIAWPHLRPAHAWLNLLGFVSLVTATTLLHFFPTVVGARIANHLSARLTVSGLAIGTAVVAAGYALDVDSAVRAGAVAAIAGAAGLAWYAARVWRTRARWTTDHAWHRFAIGGLVSAIAWFTVGLAVAAGRAALLGTASASWSTAIVIGPLVAGWVGLAILASASHLLAAVGPGDLAAHARQRRILGRAASARLVALDAGVALASLGMVLGDGWGAVTAAGLVLLAAGFSATAALIAAAVAVPLGARRPASP